MTKRLPKIYTVFCFGMLLIVALLSRFKGELHLSSNGYLLLKRSIGGSNNDALNPETRRTNTTTFEVKINGDRIYWMSWWDDFEVDRIDGSRVDRFFVLSEHYGLTEFHAWRTPEERLHPSIMPTWISLQNTLQHIIGIQQVIKSLKITAISTKDAQK